MQRSPYVIFGKTDGAAINLTDLTTNQDTTIAHAIDFQGDNTNNTLTSSSAKR